MIGKIKLVSALLAFVILAPVCLLAAGAPASERAASVLQGTWSGSFFSKHSTSGFTLTVVITPNDRGHLVGDSTMSSECLKGAKLQVTSDGSKVVLAGSDQDGNSLTIHGTLDSSGALMQATYILNGSASGACETDDGTGNLGKR